jgi:hypothetical protein
VYGRLTAGGNSVPKNARWNGNGKEAAARKKKKNAIRKSRAGDGNRVPKARKRVTKRRGI